VAGEAVAARHAYDFGRGLYTMHLHGACAPRIMCAACMSSTHRTALPLGALLPSRCM
jgi:hypothetical protein